MDKIVKEIELNKGAPCSIKEVSALIEAGVLSAQTACKLVGFEEQEYILAQAEKAKRMAEAQTAQRGDENFDASGDEKGGRGEGALPNEEV